MDFPALIDSYGYLAVFIGAFLEGETILALAGLAANRGYMDFLTVVLVAGFAGFLGDQFYFFLEGETILALAGLAAHRGYMDFLTVVVIAGFAGFLGDQFYFFLGRYKGAKILRRFPHAQERAHKFDAMLSRWHAPLIIGIRFMYGFRILGPIMLGMGRVETWKFVFYNFIGAAIWAPLIAGIGYLFGSMLETVLGDLKRVELWAFVAMVAIGLVVFAIHWLRARREDRQAPV